MARLDWFKVAASAATIGLAAVAAYAAETVAYSYDARGRLVKVEHSGTINAGLKTGYQHDKADNRTNVIVTGSAIWGTPGNDNPLSGTPADDILHGLAGNDWFYLHRGGDDTAYGGDGNDYFIFKTALTAQDVLDGGGGANSVILQGNISGLVLGANSMVNMASMSICTSQENTYGGGSGSPSVLYSYNITWINANVPAGTNRIINASSLVAGESLTFSGSAETDGSMSAYGGRGNDSVTTGAGNDVLYGGLGTDRLVGNAGGDQYRFDAATHSSGSAYDTVVGFDHQADRIDLTVAVTSFGSTVASGQLSSASFDADMGAAMSSLAAGQARLFTPDQGGLAGRIFLIVDMNAAVGYQSGADLVVEVEAPAAPIAQSTSIFI